MAHAGTQTDLAKQPAASSGLWKPFLTAVVILAIGVALAMATSFIITNRAAGGPAADASYNAIEKARGAWAQSGVAADTAAIEKAAAAKAQAMSGVAADTSYNSVENLRVLSGVTVDPIAKAAAAKAQAMSGVADNSLDAAVRATSGVAADTSYNAIENLRAQSGVTVDTSYEAAENVRGGAFPGPTIDLSTFDRTPRGAHGQLP